MQKSENPKKFHLGPFRVSRLIYINIYILKTADRTVSACWASSVQCRDLGKADTNANIYALPGAPSLWARKHHAMPECSNHRGSELCPYIYIYIYIAIVVRCYQWVWPVWNNKQALSLVCLGGCGLLGFLRPPTILRENL